MLAIDKIYNLDAMEGLKKMEDQSVQCCVTSPPYWGLRDYGIAGQMGNEVTPEGYINNMVLVFREVKRVLKDDGVLWFNIGDSYAAAPKNRTVEQATKKSTLKGSTEGQQQILKQQNKVVGSLKAKDLVGIPWRIAFALQGFAVVPYYKFSEWADILKMAREQKDWTLVAFVEGVLRQLDLLSSLHADGWYLRSDIIWAKKNCMPESVTDRPTRSHEYIFLLSKSNKYYYDHEAIKEPAIWDVDGAGTASRKARQKESNKSQPEGIVNGIRASLKPDARKMNGKHSDKQRGHSRRHNGSNDRWDQMTTKEQCTGMRNKRDVWSISPAQFPEAHFATFPEEIPAICIKAGSKEGDIILDPFMGAGTTALVAKKLTRHFVGFELNPEYIQIADKRMEKELGMFHKSVIDQ